MANPKPEAAWHARQRDPYRRIQVTINQELLEALDRAAEGRGVTRGRLIERAVREMLEG